MKKERLLPFLFIILLFSGCNLLDEEIDFPLPDKPVSEQIQGTWFNHTATWRFYDYAPADELGPLLDESIQHNRPSSGMDFWVISEEDIVIDNPDHSHIDQGSYVLIDSAGTTYLRFYTFPETLTFKIISIDDQEMVWQREELREKMEGEDKWKKQVVIQEFTKQ